MNTKIVNALMFAGGAVIGSIVTWQLVKETYRKIANEQIQETRDYYKGKYDGPQQSEPTDIHPVALERHGEREDTGARIQERKTYEEIASNYIQPESQMGVEYTTEPYVISPEDFGECDGFQTVCLTYYADKILAYDKDDQIVQDADMIVGDFEEHIGDYEDDAVHIRNEWNMTDYEILCSEKKYSEISNRDPHQMEVEWGDKMK